MGRLGATMRNVKLQVKRLLVVLIAVAALLSLLAAVSHFRRPADPTRFGPERTLLLDEARIDRREHGWRLLVRGRTNLPDGARVRIEIRTSDEVYMDFALTGGGAVTLERTSGGQVTAGNYVVAATFVLEEQAQELREALHYQPRKLEARVPLSLVEGIDAKELRAGLHALIERANAASSKEDVARVSSEAGAFERRVFVSGLTPAVRSLRRALEHAVAERSLDLKELRSEITRVEILSSF